MLTKSHPRITLSGLSVLLIHVPVADAGALNPGGVIKVPTRGPCSASPVPLTVSTAADFAQRLQYTPNTTVVMYLTGNITTSTVVWFNASYSCTIIRPQPGLTSMPWIWLDNFNSPAVRVESATNMQFVGIGIGFPVEEHRMVACGGLPEFPSRWTCPVLHIYRGWAVTFSNVSGARKGRGMGRGKWGNGGSGGGGSGERGRISGRVDGEGWGNGARMLVRCTRATPRLFAGSFCFPRGCLFVPFARVCLRATQAVAAAFLTTFPRGHSLPPAPLQGCSPHQSHPALPPCSPSLPRRLLPFLRRFSVAFRLFPVAPPSPPLYPPPRPFSPLPLPPLNLHPSLSPPPPPPTPSPPPAFLPLPPLPRLSPHNSAHSAHPQGQVQGRTDVYRSGAVEFSYQKHVVDYLDGTLFSYSCIRFAVNGDPVNLIRSLNKVVNSEIRGAWTSIMMYAGTVGTIIANNYITDFQFCGVQCGMGDSNVADCMLNTIQDNYIIPGPAYPTNNGDGAGIYYDLHWYNPGNLDTCNYIVGTTHCHYLDFTTSGLTIDGAVCIRNHDGIKVNTGHA
ncbi:unnamed protein product, partial [Closterium sp. NIES-64]